MQTDTRDKKTINLYNICVNGVWSVPYKGLYFDLVSVCMLSDLLKFYLECRLFDVPEMKMKRCIENKAYIKFYRWYIHTLRTLLVELYYENLAGVKAIDMYLKTKLSLHNK